MAFEDGGFRTFFWDELFNKSETKKQGRPIYTKTLMIQSVIPNQTTDVPRPATEEDKRKYPQSYQAFESGQEAPEDGTPLEKWHEITKGEIAMCRAAQIKTVEQLAGIADQNIEKMGPGAMNLKTRAKRFLETLNEGSVLRQENDELRERIAQLEASFEALAAEPKEKSNGSRQRFSG